MPPGRLQSVDIFGWHPDTLGPDHHDTIAFTFPCEEYNGGDVVVVRVYVMEDATHSLVTVAHHKQPNGKHTPANTQQPMSPG